MNTTVNKVGFPLLSMVVLYFYIYNPILKPGIAFGGTILILISVFYSALNYGIVSRYVKNFWKEFVLSLVIIGYIFFICLANSEDSSSIMKSLITWLLFSTIVPVFMTKVILSRNIGLVFWDVILDVGFVASVISCVALFVPPFNDFLRNIQIDFETTDELEMQLGFRCFGFANYLTSSYGYVQGLLAALCLLRLDGKHKRFLVYFITLFISIIINARTGLFPILLAIIYLFLSSLLRFKIGFLIKFMIIGLVGVLVVIKIINLFPDVVDFIQNFYEQIISILFEDEFTESYYSTRFFLPETIIGQIFGEGHPTTELSVTSDIEYVNQIFMGGFIFMGLLLLYELLIYCEILKTSESKVFTTIFFFSILVFNYKGISFYDLAAFVNLWILYYYALVHNKIYPNNQIRIV